MSKYGIVFFLFFGFYLSIQVCAQCDVVVENDSGFFAIKRNNQVITPFEFTEVGCFVEERIWVNKGEWYGFLDGSAKAITDYIYSDVQDFQNGFSVVATDSFYGLINLMGEIVLPFEFRDLRPCVDGIVLAQKDSLWGIFDTTGRQISNDWFVKKPIYTQANFLIVWKEKWGVINNRNEQIVPYKYDLITTHGELFVNGDRILTGLR
jgi:hypothetical protein